MPDESDFRGDSRKPIWQGRGYPAKYAEHPVVCVSWEDASAYCAWAGLALPTEAQWERGARGPENLLYPWGDTWDGNKCQSHHTNLSTTCPVWLYPQGASGFGTLNQSGNVWEWCQDWYDSEYYSNSPDRNPEGPTTGGLRVVRGGSMINPRPSAAFRTAELPGKGYISGYHHGDLGFRPCLPLNQSNGPRENDNSH